MNPGSDLDGPIALSELLAPEDLREVAASYADLCGVGVVIVDLDGAICARSAGGTEALGPDDTGHRFRFPITHNRDEIGSVELGPYRAGQLSDDRAAAVATACSRVLGTLVHAAHARHLTAAVHVAAMDDTYAQLEAKNVQLEEAIERLQEVDRLKSAFLATVSHELRTPLTSVIGYSEMLLEGLAGGLNNEQRDYLKTILAKADQLLHIITGILDVSLIESGSLELNREPVELSELLGEVTSGFMPQARKQEVELHSNDESDLPPVRLFGDPQKIRQVLTQLVANAIKFTHRGGSVSIHASVGALEPEQDAGKFGVPLITESDRGVRIVVQDSGIGISPEKQRHIFEPFFQVDSSSTREYGGTGLGLTLVKSYVEAHGGRVWLDSALGEGSQFTVSFPVVTEDLAAYLAVDPATS